jgi:DNA-binding transcriptional regulator YhcF (GntR family)
MMEFNDNKPIYRQIVDYAFNRIIEGAWPPGEKIPSVRELAADLGVNTRTVLKAMEDLQDADVIEPRRGMGFILADDASDKVTGARRREFFDVTLPALAEEMQRLGITPDELFNHPIFNTCYNG